MNRSITKFLITVYTVILTITVQILLLMAKASFILHVSALLLTLLVSALLVLITRRKFIDPIKQMQDITHRITQGDFSGRLNLLSGDEVGGLAENLNTLSTELQRKIAHIVRDKNELAAVIAGMQEGVLVIDTEEQIILLSPVMYSLFELRQETLGKPYWEVFRHNELNGLLEETLSTEKPIKRDIIIPGSYERHFQVQCSPVFTEENILFSVVAVFHDITELKKFERMRSEFVANVSHELKTPLTSIKGFVETLKDGALHEKDQAMHFLDIIEAQTKRLENLVNDILTLSRIESQGDPSQFKPVDISQILNAMVFLYSERLSQQKLTLKLKVPDQIPAVWAATERIEQVFVNLLDNAIKFTPEGGAITVAVSLGADRMLKIDVQDTGIGISPEHLPRLFERFYRVDKARSRELGGTGLGLAIVKHILQECRGYITVSSELKKGTVFSVYLPVVES